MCSTAHGKVVSILQEDIIQEAIEDAGFGAASIKHELKEKSELVCRIRIKGMTCTSCSSTIESALEGIHGVQRALVALATEEAEVQYNPKLVSATQFVEVVEDTGFEAVLVSTGEALDIIHLKLEGTHTEKTLQMIESLLHALPGVDAIIIDSVLQKISISYRADQIGPRDFIDVIESSKPGDVRASIYPDRGVKGTHRDEEIMGYHRSFLWSLVFTIPVFLTSMVFMYIPGVHRVLETKVVNSATVGVIFRWIFSTPVQFIIGRKFYVGSYKALRHGAANMDVLIALGTNAAYFYSVYSMLGAAISEDFVCTDYFETSSMLISFILLGKYLEVLAKGKTSEAIVKLMNLAPETAMLLIYDEDSDMVSEQEIDSRLVQKNDVIKVVPGGKVASDGYVIWGNSHVNESMITGESIPVAKREGDRVIGGTVNENGVLHVKVTLIGSETALSQIVRLVESAQLAKAPVQKLADQISMYFVPLVSESASYSSFLYLCRSCITCIGFFQVIGLAFCTWLAWFLAGKFNFYPKAWIPSSLDSFQLALQFGISVMVIACPCALGLATPTAVMVGTGVGATQGVLIKGGQALESAHKVRMK